MSSLRQSFSWWCFSNRGTEDSDLLSGAARIGYDGVELLGENLWKPALDAGLSIVSVPGHNSIEDGLNRRENAARIVGEIEENIEKAVEFRIPFLICFSGNRGGLGDEAGLNHCAETLARVTPAAERAGVVLIMELLNSKVDHHDYQCDRSAWGVELCKRVGSPSFRLLYDIYHMQVMEGDIIRTIRENHAFFAHYHTAGNPGRGPMDARQELQYPAIYRAIAETGFTGFVGHEFIPKENPLCELESAFQLCGCSIR